MTETLTIGKVAGRAGVHVETIRYYQRLGLVQEPERRMGQIRRYDEQTVFRLRFIKRAQELGFSLDEVRNLLALEDGQSCRETSMMAKSKLASIQARIADLRRMEKLLKGLITECESGKPPQACPIIGALSRESQDQVVGSDPCGLAIA